MRTKVTLVLLFLNVAVFFFVFYLGSGDRERKDTGSILGPEVVNLAGIEIAAANRGDVVRLEKRGESWSLTQPVEWPANEFAVARILNELQQLRSEASFAVDQLENNGQSLADYGLDKPPVSLTLTPAGPSSGTPVAPTVLRIGDTAKVGNRLYILSPDGQRVHVVHRSLVESLLVRIEDLRSDTIFSVQVFEARSLNVVAGSSSKVRIARSNGRWLFETPITTRANKNETDVTINRLNGLRIQSFVDAPTAEPLRWLPDDTILRITLEGNNRQETLLVGARVRSDAAATPAETAPAAAMAEAKAPSGELFYARMDAKGPVFTVSVPKPLLDTLLNAQEALRDRQILDLDPAAVTAITLSAAGDSDVTLQRLESNAPNRAGSAWQIVRRDADQGPQTLGADRERVEQLIQRLVELSAEEFVSDAPLEAMLEDKGFNRPARRIRISLTPTADVAGNLTSPSSVTLLLGIGVDRRTYAKLESPNYLYRVSDQILQQVPVEPLAYRDRLLRDMPAGARIAALKLIDLSDQSVLLDLTLPNPEGAAAGGTSPAGSAAAGEPAPASGTAPTAAPAPSAALNQAVETLVAQLRSLRAKRFVRDEFTKTVVVAGEERPWRYQLVSTLALVGGDGAQTASSALFFSERAGGAAQYAGSPEFNVVFEVEQPLVDALFAIVYGPRDPGPPAPSTPAAPLTNPAPAQPAP